MMSVIEAPHRKHEVEIKIGADSWDHVLVAIHEIEFALATHEPGNIQILSGGVPFGFSVKDQLYADMTNEKYFEQLTTYLDAQKQKSAEGAGR